MSKLKDKAIWGVDIAQNDDSEYVLLSDAEAREKQLKDLWLKQSIKSFAISKKLQEQKDAALKTLHIVNKQNKELVEERNNWIDAEAKAFKQNKELGKELDREHEATVQNISERMIIIDDLKEQNNSLENYLELINDIMWETWGVEDMPFTRKEGKEVMIILEKWSNKEHLNKES